MEFLFKYRVQRIFICPKNNIFAANIGTNFIQFCSEIIMFSFAVKLLCLCKNIFTWFKPKDYEAFVSRQLFL